MTNLITDSFTSHTFGDEDDESGWSLAVKVILGILFVIIALTNIIGNTCTLLAFAKDPKLRTVGNYYICNLAITDLIIGISSVPFYSVYTLTYFVWPFGDVFCKVYLVIDFLVCAESSLTIILISYDRLTMVQKGASYQTFATKKRALILIIASWLVAFVLYAPAIIGYDIWRGYSTVADNDCDTEFAEELVFTLVTSIIEFVVPLTVVTAFSAMLYYHIRQRARINLRQNDNAKTNAINTHRKAAKNLVLLVTAFFICWTPYTVSTLVFTVCTPCVNIDMYELFNWLLWVNSSLNPFLYAYTNARFAEHYKRFLCPWMVKRNKVRTNTLTVNTVSTIA